MPGYYPVLLDLKGKICVVIGGGKVAERKVTSLVKTDALVTVVSPEVTNPLRQLAKKKKIRYINDCFKVKYLKEAFLVIGASDSSETNDHVFKAAVKRNKLINIVDKPDKCSFMVPATVKQGDLLISISTGGMSPAFAKKIRKELEGEFGKAYKDFLSLMGRLRRKVLTQFPESKVRNEIFQTLVDSEILGLYEKGLNKKAERKAEEIISRFSKNRI